MAKPTEQERALIQAMAEYPLEPGQMLLLGPKSVAYMTGDYWGAPWLMPHVPAPGGRMMPDKHVLEREEWNE